MAERTGIIAIAVDKVLLYNAESDSPIAESRLLPTLWRLMAPEERLSRSRRRLDGCI